MRYYGYFYDFYFSEELLRTIPLMYYPKYIQNAIYFGKNINNLRYNDNNIII